MMYNLTAGFPRFQVAASNRFWWVTGPNITSTAKKGKGRAVRRSTILCFDLAGK